MNNNLISRSRTRKLKDSIHCDLLRRLDVLSIVFQVSHQACLSSLTLNCNPDCPSLPSEFGRNSFPPFSKAMKEQLSSADFLLFIVESFELLTMCQQWRNCFQEHFLSSLRYRKLQASHPVPTTFIYYDYNNRLFDFRDIRFTVT